MKNVIQMISVLSLLCAIAGFGLSYLKQSTAAPIENQLLTYVQGPAILDVFTDIENVPLDDRKKLTLADGRTINVFPAIKGGQLIGVAIEGFGAGYGGDIGVMAGFDINTDNLVAIGITTMRETPGIGTVIAEENFTKIFVGKATPVALSSEGGEIDAISGATVSSKGTIAAINMANGIYKELKPQILESWEAKRRP